jgi:hypothetical protein
LHAEVEVEVHGGAGLACSGTNDLPCVWVDSCGLILSCRVRGPRCERVLSVDVGGGVAFGGTDAFLSGVGLEEMPSAGRRKGYLSHDHNK